MAKVIVRKKTRTIVKSDPVTTVVKLPMVGPQGPQGEQGEPADLLNPRGAWDENETYVANDLVSWAGRSWVADGPVAAGEEPGVATVWKEFFALDLVDGGALI